MIRPEDIKIVAAGKGNVDGKIISRVFKGVHYEYDVQVGRKSEVIIQSTIEYPENEKVGLAVAPDDIHIMKKEVTTNVYADAWIDNKNRLMIGDNAFEIDITQLLKGSTVDEEGYLVGPDAKKYDLDDVDVVATIDFKDIELDDVIEEDAPMGQIISIIWLGDHYQVIVRTNDEEDFIVDSEYLWNEGDLVSIIIKPEDIKLKLKGELVPYEN